MHVSTRTLFTHPAYSVIPDPEPESRLNTQDGFRISRTR